MKIEDIIKGYIDMGDLNLSLCKDVEIDNESYNKTILHLKDM